MFTTGKSILVVDWSYFPRKFSYNKALSISFFARYSRTDDCGRYTDSSILMLPKLLQKTITSRTQIRSFLRSVRDGTKKRITVVVSRMAYYHQKSDLNHSYWYYGTEHILLLFWKYGNEWLQFHQVIFKNYQIQLQINHYPSNFSYKKKNNRNFQRGR